MIGWYMRDGVVNTVHNCIRIDPHHPTLPVFQYTGSDVIYVNVAGTHMIVINSMSVLKDLFVDRSAIYSSR
jgi:hypothetical protein